MSTKSSQTIYDTAIVIPDAHGELVDRQALECVLQGIEILKPKRVIMLGDLGEWSSVNHHEHARIKKPAVEIIAAGIRRDAHAVARYVLNPIDSACESAGVKIKDMLTGNHDRWLDGFVEANPDYANTSFGEATGYRFDQIFDWKKRGWQVHPCGKLLKIGKLHFYHGHHYGGIYHSRAHLIHFGVSIMYGNFHDVAYSSMTTANGTIGAWCLGCIKQLAPSANRWLEHRPTNWSHAFAFIEWRRNGRFTVHVMNIIEGQTSLMLQFIDGRHPRRLR